MVKMVLPLMLEGAFQGSSGKFVALLKAAAELPDVQEADEHCEKGLASDPILFCQHRAVQITNTGLHCMVVTPIRGVSPCFKSFESPLHALLHRHVDSDPLRTRSGMG